MKYRLILSLLWIFCLSSRGHAFCFSGWQDEWMTDLYVGAFGGMNGGYRLNCETRTDRGYYLGAKAGGRLYSFLRAEGEVAWQGNDVNSSHVGTVQLDHVRGHVNIWSFMANALTDFNCDFPVRPFIGLGGGYAFALGDWKGRLEQVNGNFFIVKNYIKSSFNKRGICWQAILGLKYFIYPNLEVNVEYRLFNLKGRSNHKLGLALTNFF